MFEMIVGLAGGLALFIYGMQCMGEGLQKLAGDKLKKILGVLTSTPVIGVAVGAAITSIVQSSSLTTVMAVGFVNASMMSLKQAISVIMGANIGTTITAQLVAFNITEYWALLVALGFVAYFFISKKPVKRVGYIVFALGLLLLGMILMGEAMAPLKTSPKFQEIILALGRYKLLGLLLGTVFTALVQSSSASIGLLITMSAGGLIPIETAIPILLGANIGTCVTALLATVGMSVNARRVAIAHILFNVLGAVIFLILLEPLAQIVVSLSPDSVARQIANAHTLVNVVMTLLVLPFINPFTRLVQKLAPEKEYVPRSVVYLDWKLVDSPQIAINLAQRELLHMATLAGENLTLAVEALAEVDLNKADRVHEQEEMVDELEKEICRYLARSGQSSMTDDLSRTHTGLLHAANDIERISDHANNIAELTEALFQTGLVFSDTAKKGLSEIYQAVEATYSSALQAFSAGDKQIAVTVHAQEQTVDELERSLRSAHMKRLVAGDCHAESGVLFLDAISNLERVSDHADNIADLAAGIM